MNRDEIIALAREASGGTDWWPVHSDTLERFAALITARATSERKRRTVKERLTDDGWKKTREYCS